MTVQEFYGAIGSDYSEISARLGSERLISRLLSVFGSDPSFNELNKAFFNNDAAAAFRAVHTLKGVSLNMGFSKLAESCSLLTEKLRHASDPDMGSFIDLLNAVRSDYSVIIENLKQL